MWIVIWDQFLIKKLLKSKVWGICEQCTGALFTAKKSKHAVGKKKKKERNTYVDLQMWVQTDTKGPFE